MNAGELLQKMGTDAKIWAEEFNKIIVDKGEQPYDPELLIGWFANAIMAGYDSAYQKVSKSIDGLHNDKTLSVIIYKIMQIEWILANDPKGDTDESIEKRIKNGVLSVTCAIRKNIL